MAHRSLCPRERPAAPQPLTRPPTVAVPPGGRMSATPCMPPTSNNHKYASGCFTLGDVRTKPINRIQWHYARSNLYIWMYFKDIWLMDLTPMSNDAATMTAICPDPKKRTKQNTPLCLMP